MVNVPSEIPGRLNAAATLVDARSRALTHNTGADEQRPYVIVNVLAVARAEPVEGPRRRPVCIPSF